MTRLRLTPRRWIGHVTAAGAGLLLVLIAAVLVNPRALRRDDRADLSWERVAHVLTGGGDDVARVVVWHARVPRVLLAAVVGASLAVAGALLQVLLRNPLADPFVLGVSSGAALASVVGVALGMELGGAGHPIAAAGGALLTAFGVHRLARNATGGLSSERLVLAGVVLSYGLSAGVMWVVSLSRAEESQRYLFWLMGSVASASGRQVVLAAVTLALVATASAWVLPALNLLVISEEHAMDSGVRIEAVKRITFVLAAVLTGTAVAVSGSIGFVGLVVPHATRLLTGTDARLAVPLSALGGAAFLVIADFACRALGELPLGVATATCGAPFFLWLLARKRE